MRYIISWYYTLLNNSGFVKGSSTTSLICRICSLSPPTSEYLIFPGSSACIENTRGSTSRGKILITVRVVISKETLTPETSLSFGIFVFTVTTYRGPEEAFTIYSERKIFSFKEFF